MRIKVFQDVELSYAIVVLPTFNGNNNDNDNE